MMADALPERIYKYQPGSVGAITNLAAGRIWFSDPMRFNDPFDCAIDLIDKEIQAGFERSDTADCIEVLAALKVAPEIITQLMQESEAYIKRLACNAVRSNLEKMAGGVSCFSDCRDSMLMWGHYAECHKGFCLEFTTEFPPFSDPAKLRRVKYHNKFPQFDVSRLARDGFRHLLDFMLAKAEFWSYEREWRLIHNEKDKQYYFERHCLTSVYFGAKMPEENQCMIGHLLEKMPTKLYRAKLKDGEYSLSFEPYEFKAIDYRIEPGPNAKTQ